LPRKAFSQEVSDRAIGNSNVSGRRCLVEAKPSVGSFGGLRQLLNADHEQGEPTVAEANKQQREQSGERAGQDKNQQKSDAQRRAEEAARRDKAKGGASSVGTAGT
jgi:hypothetical protein